MKLISKVRAVQRLFGILDKDVEDLQKQTGISCIKNCVKCCTTSHIEATALEFYPLAHHLYLTGQAENLLAKIEQSNDLSICPALNNFSVDGMRPGCNFYEYRGLICRLFAYNYNTDKYGKRRIHACKAIRITQPEQIELANKILQTKAIGPRASNYYLRLQMIDYTQAQRLYPIGEAVKTAIETVISTYHFNGSKAM